MSSSKNKVKKEEYKITEKVEFRFTYYKNAINVANALVMSGYFIKLRKENFTYILKVFTDRD